MGLLGCILLMGDFKKATWELISIDSSEEAAMVIKVRPKGDQLFKISNQLIFNRLYDIKKNIIKDSNLRIEEQTFLNMYLKRYEISSNSNLQDTLNALATKFINEYPNTELEYFVRHYLRYVFKPNGFSLGMELFTGVGFLGGNTKSNFYNGGTFGMGFIFGLNKFEMNTRFCLIFSSLKNNIEYNNYNWTSGSSALLPQLEIIFDYQIKLKQKINFSPLIGIGWFLPSPDATQDNPDYSKLKSIQINSYPLPVVGFDFGYNIINRFVYNNFQRQYRHGYFSLNLRYEIEPVYFLSPYNYMNGIMQNVSIGIKCGGGGAKRVY